MYNNSASCGNGDIGNVENECEISEPCNSFERDNGPPMKKLKRSNRKLDQKIGRELITQMVIHHDLPFNFVEWDGFRAFSNYISFNEAHCVSRNVVATDVMEVYLLEKEKLKKQLAEINGSVCLSCLCWTSPLSSRGYFSLAVHYMDEIWKLNVKLLNFCHLDPPHDDFTVSKKVFECMQVWGIERKVCSITVDNASNHVDLQDLRKQLCSMDSLLSNGDYFQFRCCASVLDLMVHESLKVVSSLLHKIRKSVKYVSESNLRMQQFYKCVEDVGGIDAGDGLHLDVSANWNSTYLMLKSAIKYRRAFEHMHLKDMTYRHCPSSEEWVRGKKICDFLGIFDGLFKLISESTNPISEIYLEMIWTIELSLKEMKLGVDDKIRDMASKMLDEFDKYLSEFSMILAFGIVLNPSLKFDCLEYLYERVVSDISIVKEKVSNVRKALNALLNEYVKKGAPTSSRVSTSTKKLKRGSVYLKFREYLEEERQKKYAAGFTQLDLYLEESNGNDVKKALDYWKGQGKIYGDLARLARDVLSIPIISVASESPFSVGGSILNKYRSCIISDNLQALVCSRNWLFGFPSRDQSGDVIEATRKIGINPCQQDSHSIFSNENKNED